MTSNAKLLLGLVGVVVFSITFTWLAHAQTTNFTNLSLSGTLSVTGATTLTGAVTYAGAQTFNGQVTLGDGGDTVAINSSDWDISAAGVASGFSTIMLDAVANTDPTTVNFTSYGRNGIVSEGTADAAEWSLIIGDAAADSSLTLEAAGGLLLGNATVNADPTTAGFSAWGSTGFVFEGATADASEFQLIVTDPTADSSWTVPAGGGMTVSTGAITASNGRITATDADGFGGATGGTHAQFSGITSVARDYVVGTAGRTEAQTWREDGETTGTWDEVTCAGGANTCVAVPSTDDTTNEKFGATAQSITIGTMVATDTIGMAAFGGEDWEALENVGIWARADSTTLGTDWRFQVVDDGGTQSFALEAITVANQWQFLEVDISALAGGTGDVITQILIECNHATNCNGITFLIDNIYVWDTADETALNFDILDQPGAVGSAWSFVTADAGAQSHARTLLVHGDTIAGSATDFLIDPDDNTLISIDDNSAVTIDLLYHRANY